jgi:transposase
MLDRLSPSIEELDLAVKKETDHHPDAVCLMEQSGVGPVTALAFVMTIGPIDRFSKSKQLVSYRV